ncbi:hypothetical protein K491DRAFT_690837 [Lophiostoma macrostomum CBS 122681]|uniref:Uncharacterized protein n=1 Tax=Lophiostoma macrostomum CBS 122681 TaxID=1314788 RepID=A0A6A6TF25_9PLEO|nr:hypothetical protein K491DRAFT_690837 [Lophiostoma macrostomum CBS 122681]
MWHANNTLASSTAHRDKRQFQPSITSFFFREDSYSGDEDEEEERGLGPITRRQQHHHHASERAVRDSLAPNLPHTVQADLLSVGMRVRKSVPEGYKTSKTVTLPTIQTTLAKTHYVNTHAVNVNVNINAGDAYSVKPPRDPVPDTFQHQRELLPFCGLHKIGGFAEQPVTNVHLYAGADANGDRPVNVFPLPAEAFNQPFSSQDSDSLSSVTTPDALPNPTNPHKRSWQDEDARLGPGSFNANFMFALPMKVAEDEVPVSPLSATPAQSAVSLPQSALRPFAQPKTRRQGMRLVDVEGGVFKEVDIDMDVENAELGDLPGSNPNDFGEAEFLRPWSAREVEMGGI